MTKVKSESNDDILITEASARLNTCENEVRRYFKELMKDLSITQYNIAYEQEYIESRKINMTRYSVSEFMKNNIANILHHIQTETVLDMEGSTVGQEAKEDRLEEQKQEDLVRTERATARKVVVTSKKKKKAQDKTLQFPANTTFTSPVNVTVNSSSADTSREDISLVDTPENNDTNKSAGLALATPIAATDVTNNNKAGEVQKIAPMLSPLRNMSHISDEVVENSTHSSEYDRLLLSNDSSTVNVVAKSGNVNRRPAGSRSLFLDEENSNNGGVDDDPYFQHNNNEDDDGSNNEEEEDEVTSPARKKKRKSLLQPIRHKFTVNADGSKQKIIEQIYRFYNASTQIDAVHATSSIVNVQNAQQKFISDVELMVSAYESGNLQEYNTLLDKTFAELVASEVIRTSKSKIATEINVAAYWQQKRVALNVPEGEIIVIKISELHSMVSDLVLKAILIRPKTSIEGGVVIYDRSAKLSPEDAKFNASMRVTVCQSMTKIFREITILFDELNQKELSENEHLKDAGFVFNSDLSKLSIGSQSVLEAFNVDIQSVDPDDLREFAEQITQKVPKDKFASAEKHREREEKRRLRKLRETENIRKSILAEILAAQQKQSNTSNSQQETNTSNSQQEITLLDKNQTRIMISPDGRIMLDNNSDEKQLTSDTTQDSGENSECRNKNETSSMCLLSGAAEQNANETSPNSKSTENIRSDDEVEFVLSGKQLAISLFESSDSMKGASSTVQIVHEKRGGVNSNYPKENMRNDRLSLVLCMLTLLQNSPNLSDKELAGLVFDTSDSLNHIKFSFYKAFPSDNDTLAWPMGMRNTRGDGYCFARSMAQAEMQHKTIGVTTEELITFDQNLTKMQIAGVLKSFIKSVKYAYAPDQSAAMVRLKAALWNATHLADDSTNPEHSYGLGDWVRFAPFPVSCFTFTSDPNRIKQIDGVWHCWATMTNVSFATFNQFMDSGTPQVTIPQIRYILTSSQHLGFRVNHFFILPSDINDNVSFLQSVDTAVKNWLTLLARKVIMWSDTDREKVLLCKTVEFSAEMENRRIDTPPVVEHQDGKPVYKIEKEWSLNSAEHVTDLCNEVRSATSIIFADSNYGIIFADSNSQGPRGFFGKLIHV